MTVEELMKKASLSDVARLLNLSAPAVYKWKKTNKIPPLRLFQLRELRPQWFKEE